MSERPGTNSEDGVMDGAGAGVVLDGPDGRVLDGDALPPILPFRVGGAISRWVEGRDDFDSDILEPT